MQDPRAAVVSLRECLSRQPGSKPAKALLRQLQAQLSVQCQAPGADVLRRAACVTPPTGWDWRYTPSQDGCSQNLTLMLHGLGDSPEPYASLAQSLKIPQVQLWIIAQGERLLKADKAVNLGGAWWPTAS
uniref:Phospholipase/carboxylesterase/thioesterase domain-containing protein n=1 Tax=Auxenochlorella protothecoides TaxID=3075 RepID=A0A1D1ZNB6_AUXPR